jgi:hypothetical protein
MSVLLAALLAVAAPPESLPYEPTEAYARDTIEGWPIYMNRRFARSEPKLAERTLAELRFQLYQIGRAVPEPSLARLREIPIWVELDNDKKHPCCCYHVSADWLKENGFNPRKARSVEICSAERFLEWTRQQPWMILHELSHGFHHRELTYEEPRIRAAYEQAVAEGKYEAVLRWNGRRVRHYALNNPQEYFAEATEAYFGTNDFFPFVRAELREYDARMYRLIEGIWGVKEE